MVIGTTEPFANLTDFVSELIALDASCAPILIRVRGQTEDMALRSSLLRFPSINTDCSTFDFMVTTYQAYSLVRNYRYWLTVFLLKFLIHHDLGRSNLSLKFAESALPIDMVREHRLAIDSICKSRGS